MTAITTHGWGVQGGLVTTRGWGGSARIPPPPIAIRTPYCPKIVASLEIRPELIDSDGGIPEIVGAQDAGLSPKIVRGMDLRPSIGTGDEELRPQVSDSGGMVPRIVPSDGDDC